MRLGLSAEMIPSNSVTIPIPRPNHDVGLLIPNRSMALRRSLSSHRPPANLTRRLVMRYIGVDLHKTNFVVCFLSEDDRAQTETFPLNGQGLARFKRRLRPDD